MKKTLRLLIMGMAVIGLLASCNKENNNTNTTDVNGKGFKAGIEKSGDSKTHLNGLDVHWTSYDLIRVANANNESAVFELTGGADTYYGLFYTGSEFDFTSPYKAVYPAYNPEQEENTIDGTTATFKLPAVQNITATESFGEGYNPMVAYDATADDRELQFKNLCGGLILPLKGLEAGHHVSSIVLTANNADDILWGTGTADCTSADPVLSMTNTAATKNQIALNCDITLSAESSKKFYIMLPPGTLTTGFSFQVFDGTTVIYEKGMSWANNPEFIKRNWLMEANDQSVGELPVVVTKPISDLQQKSVTFNGELTDEGNPAATVRGLCWGTSDMPTIGDGTSTVTTNGTGLGTYSEHITGLTPGTTYYVRAYATNAHGTVYGEVISVKMPTAYFSVSADDVVYLAPGNLQYRGGSYNQWRFAEKQWHFVGTGPDLVHTADLGGVVYQDGVKCDNEKIAQSYTGWIDLFGWGTSGYNGCNPWKNDTNNTEYGPASGDIANTEYDWGVHNSIYNPKRGATDAAGTWRTPTYSEIGYLLFTRSASTVNGVANARFAKAIINDIVANKLGDHLKGLILLPDYYEHPENVPAMNNINALNSNYEYSITEAQWYLLEAEGAMFLPIADFRNWNTSVGSFVGHLCSYGVYWTATVYDNENANTYRFGATSVDLQPQRPRYHGYAVRLVKDTTK